MTNDYQDLQHLDNEDNDHHLRQVPPAPQPLLRRLCSGPCLLLLSLGLSVLLLVVVCVIGSQNSKLWGELQALRETFSNFTASTEVEVKALSSQGGNVGRKMKSLESQLEKQQKDLSEGQRGCVQGRWGPSGQSEGLAVAVAGPRSPALGAPRSLGPAAAREAVRVGPAKPELSDCGAPWQRLHADLLPSQLAGVRGQLLLVLPLREVLARGRQVLPAGECAPGGRQLQGGAEVHPAPHGAREHLDGPHGPEWALEVGGRDGLRDRLQELEARAARRLVRARARGRRGLRALHGRRPLERRRVPEALPLGVRGGARPRHLWASSPLIYFHSASPCPVIPPPPSRGGRPPPPPLGLLIQDFKGRGQDDFCDSQTHVWRGGEMESNITCHGLQVMVHVFLE